MHRFNPKHAAKLDDPERLKWQPVETILSSLELTDGLEIVDFGCGTCYLSNPLAGKYPRSNVYGIDISPEMLDICIAKNSPANLHLELIKNGKTSLANGIADVIFIINTFHELADDVKSLDEINRLSKKGTRMTVVDWKKIEMDFGPDVEERLEPSQVSDILQAYGFKLLKEDKTSLPYHYILVYAK